MALGDRELDENVSYIKINLRETHRGARECKALVRRKMTRYSLFAHRRG